MKQERSGAARRGADNYVNLQETMESPLHLAAFLLHNVHAGLARDSMY
jgi:hypothetical protein